MAPPPIPPRDARRAREARLARSARGPIHGGPCFAAARANSPRRSIRSRLARDGSDLMLGSGDDGVRILVQNIERSATRERLVCAREPERDLPFPHRLGPEAAQDASNGLERPC